VLARAPDFAAETLYVVGGLYGNLAALDKIKALVAAERALAETVFNGDFHWFDAAPDWFAAIEAGVAPYRSLRGNIETEVAREADIGAGCGCAYPDSVDDGVVERSNAILSQLAEVVPASARARLRDLPMHLVAKVGALRVGIVHGDAGSLAGWRFAHDSLDDALDDPLDNAHNRPWLAAVHDAAQVDVFASTHTCLAALRDFDLPAGRLTVVNNGSAGMPNFSGSRYGVITRIATTPSPHPPLYGIARDGIFIDAIAVDYDSQVFLAHFLKRWPPGSEAHNSYFKRIVGGPDHALSRGAAT